MDNRLNKQLKQQNPDLHQLFLALAQILNQYNMEYDQFNKTLRKYYVLEAYGSCQTVARTALKCGIDRRCVTAIIYNKEKPIKPSSLNKILSQIEKLARQNNMLVAKQGKQSIQRIVLKLANGATTLNSIVAQLQAQGCIEDLGQQIRFITNNFNQPENKSLQHMSIKLYECLNAQFNNLHEV